MGLRDIPSTPPRQNKGARGVDFVENNVLLANVATLSYPIPLPLWALCRAVVMVACVLRTTARPF